MGRDCATAAMVPFTSVCHVLGTRVLTSTTFFMGGSEARRRSSCVVVNGPLVPSSRTRRVPMSPAASSDGTVACTCVSCWPTLASITMPGSICWRYGAASIMIESPMAVTPWPAGGGGPWWWWHRRPWSRRWPRWWWSWPGGGPAAARRGVGGGVHHRHRHQAAQPHQADGGVGRHRAGHRPLAGPELRGPRPPVVADPLPEAAQRAVADGLLDVPPREGGQADAGGHLERGPQDVGRGVERGGEDDDRVVPQVDAVGALADPAQGLPAEPAPAAEPRGAPPRR